LHIELVFVVVIVVIIVVVVVCQCFKPLLEKRSPGTAHWQAYRLRQEGEAPEEAEVRRTNRGGKRRRG
jgi:hypothetical protein